MRFYMTKISVFGPVLLLVRDVNQQIETGTIGISVDDRPELLLMER